MLTPVRPLFFNPTILQPYFLVSFLWSSFRLTRFGCQAQLFFHTNTIYYCGFYEWCGVWCLIKLVGILKHTCEPLGVYRA